jgi:hypothetical protein
MLPKHGSYHKSVESIAILWQSAVGYKHTGKKKNKIGMQYGNFVTTIVVAERIQLRVH